MRQIGDGLARVRGELFQVLRWSHRQRPQLAIGHEYKQKRTASWAYLGHALHSEPVGA